MPKCNFFCIFLSIVTFFLVSLRNISRYGYRKLRDSKDFMGVKWTLKGRISETAFLYLGICVMKLGNLKFFWKFSKSL